MGCSLCCPVGGGAPPYQSLARKGSSGNDVAAHDAATTTWAAGVEMVGRSGRGAGASSASRSPVRPPVSAGAGEAGAGVAVASSSSSSSASAGNGGRLRAPTGEDGDTIPLTAAVEGDDDGDDDDLDDMHGGGVGASVAPKHASLPRYTSKTVVKRRLDFFTGVSYFAVFAGDAPAVSFAHDTLDGLLVNALAGDVEGAAGDAAGSGAGRGRRRSSSAAPMTVNPSTDFAMALTTAFHATNRAMEDAGVGAEYGCSAVVCILATSPTQRVLHTANTGTAHAVLGSSGSAFRLSEDHSTGGAAGPGRMRTASSMSKLASDGLHGGGSYRSIRGADRGPGMSRCLGNIGKPGIMGATPHTSKTVLHEGDSVVVLASAGVWAVMSDQDVVNCVSQHMTPQSGAEELGQEVLDAADRLRRRSSRHGSDDDSMAVVTVLLE